MFCVDPSGWATSLSQRKTNFPDELEDPFFLSHFLSGCCTIPSIFRRPFSRVGSFCSGVARFFSLILRTFFPCPFPRVFSHFPKKLSLSRVLLYPAIVSDFSSFRPKDFCNYMHVSHLFLDVFPKYWGFCDFFPRPLFSPHAVVCTG